MNMNQSLHQFSWEEWDNQMIVVLYRSDRRFVVKRYIERVLVNSLQWQQFSRSSFSNIEPIAQAYPMTENEVKLMHHIFSWHLNGTLTFPIIGGLDQLLDWEDVLDFIQRAQQTAKKSKQDQPTTRNSPSMTPTIPVGRLSSTISTKKTEEKNKTSEPKKGDSIPIKINKKLPEQQRLVDDNILSSSIENHWVQINNICVPYIIKSEQTRFLPYQVLLDCNLFNDQEQLFLLHFTTKANSNDIQNFERIISSSTSIDFKLNHDLLLLDLYHLIFGMSNIIYIKLLNQQRDVNKSYKTVLAQCGGTVIFHSHSIPFISLGKLDYILLDSFISILQPTTKIISSLRRRAVLAQSHEIEYLRLIQFYQQKHQQDDSILSNQSQEQYLISTNEIQKYLSENELVIDLLLTQYQQAEYRKMRKQMEITENKSIRKPTKRKAGTAMTEIHNSTTERR